MLDVLKRCRFGPKWSIKTAVWLTVSTLSGLCGICINISNSTRTLRSMLCHLPALGAHHSSLESWSQAYFGYSAGARKVSMADVILALSCSLPASCISLWREPSMRTTQVP